MTTSADRDGTVRPLTLPERVLLSSDRPEVPVVVALLGRTDGHVDAAALTEAATVVFANHRATRSELADRAGVEGWRSAARPRRAPVAEVEVASREDAWSALRRLILPGIDLGRAPLVRLLVAHHPAGDFLGAVAHHLALDGRGLLTLLTEMTACYQPSADWAEPGGEARALPRYRPIVGLRPAVRGRVLRRLAAGPRFLAPVGPPGAGGLAFVPRVVATPRPASLPDGRVPSVNDLLIAAGHLAADRWNSRRGRVSGTLRVRVAVGGVAHDQLEGAATGFALVASDPALRAQPTRLLAAVLDRTTAIKARGPAAPPGLAGPGLQGKAVRLADLLITATPPRARAAVLRLAIDAARPVFMPTLAVSNLGHVPSGLTVGLDGPRLLDMHFAATPRMPQGLVVHVARMAGQVHLTFTYALELFDAAAAREFADLFLAAMAELEVRFAPEAAVRLEAVAARGTGPSRGQF